jgi:hypothetical protein
MNPKLKAIAEKIRKLSNIPEEETFGSVIAILMIISITLTLIRVLQECNKNKLSQESTAQDKYALYGAEIRSFSMKRGWFTKLRIKKVMRQRMSKEQYSKYSLALLGSLLDIGENLKDDEVITLVEASNV